MEAAGWAERETKIVRSLPSTTTSLFPSVWRGIRFPPWSRRMRRTHALVVAACMWLPLALIAWFEWLRDHRAPFGTFLRDAEVHVRLLVALPLLALVAGPVAEAVELCLAHFTKGDLIDRTDPGFVRAVAALRRRERSRLADLVILVLAVVVGVSTAEHIGAWGFAVSAPSRLGLAGAFHTYVAAPVYQFFVFRWAYRWIVWNAFIVRTAFLKLRLHATHADRCGGLAFLAQPAVAFSMVLFASSTVLSARWSSKLVRTPGDMTGVLHAILLYLALVLFLQFVPFVFHVPRLVRLRRDAIFSYGVLAQKVSAAFAGKWQRPEWTGEEFLDVNDPSALVDFNSDYEVVRSLRPIPLGLWEVALFALYTLLPMLALPLVDQRVADALRVLVRALF